MKFFLILNLVCLLSRSAIAQSTYIEYLNEKDREQYSLNCKKNQNSFKPNCLNFLGIKIFYVSIQEVLDNEKKRIELQKISVSLIKKSADMGFRKAFFNLGWIYSNDKFFNQDLEKASFYFKQAKKRTVSEKKEIELANQSELKKIQKSNLFYLQLAIGLFENIKLYYISKVKGHEQYITKQQFDIAKSLYDKILENSYFSEMDIGAIKKNVISERTALISFLAEDLKIFKDDYRKNAIKDLNKLYNIRNKLDKLEAR